MRQAPWADFNGMPIFDGDKIVHPSGETGTVKYFEHAGGPDKQWWVDYWTGECLPLRSLVGDKGQAVVVR